MAKKKMSKAEAASARKELTPERMRRAKSRERSRLIKKSAANAQRQARKGIGLRMILPFVVVAAIVVFALVFTIGPGMLMGS